MHVQHALGLSRRARGVVQDRWRFRRGGRHREIGRGLAHEAAIAEHVGGQVVVRIHQQDMAQVGQPVADAVNLLEQALLGQQNARVRIAQSIQERFIAKVGEQGAHHRARFQTTQKGDEHLGQLGQHDEDARPWRHAQLGQHGRKSGTLDGELPVGEIGLLAI